MIYPGRSLAGPQSAQWCAAAVKATPLRGRIRSRALTATAPPRKPACTGEGSGVVLDGSRQDAVAVSLAISCLLFVVYDQESTRINRYQECLTSNLIGWWTNKFGLYRQPPRTVGR